MPKGFKPNQAAIKAFLGPGTTERTPFGRELHRFAKDVEEGARRKALEGYPRKDRPGYRPGGLKKGIKAEPVRQTSKGLEVKIRARRVSKEGVDVAMVIHQGHKEIWPKDKPIKFIAREKGRYGKRFIIIRPIDADTLDEMDASGVRPGLTHIRAVGPHPFLVKALEESAVKGAVGVVGSAQDAVRWNVTHIKKSPHEGKRPPARSKLYINR